MGRPLQVLIVEDHNADAQLMVFELERAGFDVVWQRVDTEAAYLAGLRPTLDIILSDYSLPGFDAPRALELVQSCQLDIPFIVVTGRATEEDVVECMRQGAVDYLLKDRLSRLGPAVLRALEDRTRRAESRRAEEAARRERDFSRSLINGSMNGILAFDAEFRYTRWNPAMERLTGIPCEQALGRNAFELFPFFREIGVDKAHHAALRGESTVYHDLPFSVPSTGRQGIVEAQYSPLLDDEGHIIGGLGFLQDVTERKMAREALAMSEIKFRSLIENSSDMIAVVDEHGVMRYGSPATRRMLGYSPERMIGRNVFWHVHPEDAERLMSVFVPVAGRPSAFGTAELRFLRQDGTWRILEVIGRNLLGDPAVQGIVLNARDISDRKKAEADLHYRLAFEKLIANISTQFINLEPHQMDAGIYDTLESVGRFLDVDRGYLFQFQDEPDVLTNTHQWHREGVEPLHGDRQNWPLDEFRWLAGKLEQGHDVNVPSLADLPAEASAEKRRLQQMGTHSLILLPMFLRSAPQGFLGFESVQRSCSWSEDIIALLKIVSEIFSSGIERRHAEAALRESESRYRALVETSPDAIVLVDLDANILMCNLQKALLHGYHSPQQMMGRNTMEFVAPEDYARVSTQLSSIRSTGGVRNIEYTMLRKDGSRFFAEFSASLITDEEARPRAIASVYRDITERKKTDALLQRQLARTTALRRIDVAITASLELRVTLDVILEQVLEQLQIDAACVLLLNPESQMLEYTAGQGFRTGALQFTRLHLGQGYAGDAALHHKVLQVPDLRRDHGEFGRAPSLFEEEFVTYFGVPLEVKGKIVGVLEVFHRSALEADADWKNFLEVLAAQAAIAIDNAQLLEELHRSNDELNFAYEATLEGWSRALDLRDKETEGHTQRVTEYTLSLAREFSLSEAELVQVRRGALLHDIGKMGIPDSILLKPGKLTDEEWVIMRKHPTFAYELLSPITYLRPALDIPLYHHEKWDGSGYPRGLKGEEIPLSARIFAVIDVWDALRSDRPYRDGWPVEKVREHISDGAGSHFDPAVVHVFEQMNIEDFERRR
jgi:PAS domain S-box-containing protein